ncbi:amidase family protein [Nocardia elegans]|uniref:LexA family protein n=1 Tax=Nocardia elegans TaxID=300029 RepID=UPI002B4AF928|nr:amidase family protein [Nocardia elegans]
MSRTDDTGEESGVAVDPALNGADLTVRQRKVLEVIRTSVSERGYPPSIREIGDAVGLTSTSSVAHQLRALERKGYLRRDPNRPRAVDVRGLDEAVRAVTETARLLESLGHTVESAEPAIDGVRLARDFMTVWTTHLAASVADTCERTGAKPTDFDVDTQTMAAVGRTVPAPALVTAGDRWNEYTRALADFHGRYDLLLTPTLAEPPQPIGTNRLPAALETILPPILRAGAGHLISRSSMYRGMVTSHLAATPFTQLANVTGRPAMSVPLHTTADGLPLGVHFTGPSGSEALLLRLAAQLETAAPWFDRHPPADPTR